MNRMQAVVSNLNRHMSSPRGYADGGIVGFDDPMAEGGPAAMAGGITEAMAQEDLMGSEGMPPGGEAALYQIVSDAKSALEGTHPDPEAALETFIEVFGEEELDSLQAAILEEMQGGPPADPSMGDGMSDSIPATIDGVEPAALSEGEYVVDARSVSDLGNGDTGSGARALDGMVNGLRMERGGEGGPTPPINPEEFMPLPPPGYSGGGLVGYRGRSNGR